MFLSVLVPGGLAARPDMPSPEQVREALEVLQRFEAALAAQSSESSQTESQGPKRGKGIIHLGREPLTSATVGGAPSVQIVEAPASFSLTIDGDMDLSGYVFQGGVPFIHNDGGAAYGNTAAGLNALRSATPYFHYNYGPQGAQNSAFGYGALQDTTLGDQNTGTGFWALRYNTEGQNNTANGGFTLWNNTLGGANTAIGFAALESNTEGSGNTAAGNGALGSNTTGAGNTAIGLSAGAMWTTGDHNIAVGMGAYGVGGESGIIRIGGNDFQTKTYIEGIFGGDGSAGVAVYVDSSNQLGTKASSARFKQDVHDLKDISGRLLSLRPVSFRYKGQPVKGGSRPIEYGLVAEEVAEIFPELVVNDDEGRPFSVRYHLLTPLLLNEWQRHERQIEGLHSQLGELRRRLDQLAE